MSEGTFVETALPTGLQPETLPDLSELADEPNGPLPKGWYAAEIVEGYATRKGKQFLTEDSLSKNGDSRNLLVCFKLTPFKGDPRNLNVRLNYRSSDFSADRIAFIKEQREANKGVKSWADKDAQRSSLALAFVGQFQKALGFQLGFINGGIVVGPAVGKSIDVHVTINEDGYNDIYEFAPAGKMVPRKS